VKPEESPENPPPASPEAQPEGQPEAQPKVGVSVDGGAPTLPDEARSSTLGDTTPSPSSSSSSSSLRSILKKPSSTSEKKDSDSGTESAGENEEDNKLKLGAPRRPKTKKSVSFTDATVPAASPPARVIGGQVSAAEAGAAIAKKLIEKENACKISAKGLRPVGGSDGSVDSVGGAGKPKKRGDNVRGVGRARNLGNQWSVDTPVTGRIGRARAPHRLLADAEDDSNIDDEIPGRWP
jgi:hypothetical protein